MSLIGRGRATLNRARSAREIVGGRRRRERGAIARTSQRHTRCDPGTGSQGERPEPLKIVRCAATTTSFVTHIVTPFRHLVTAFVPLRAPGHSTHHIVVTYSIRLRSSSIRSLTADTDAFHIKEFRVMRRATLGALVALIAVLATSAIAAQERFGGLAGVVTDSSQAPVPGVTVTATNKQTGAARTTVTGVGRRVSDSRPRARPLHGHRRAHGLPEGPGRRHARPARPHDRFPRRRSRSAA